MFKVYEYIESDLDKLKFSHWSRYLKNKKMLKGIKRYLADKNTAAFSFFDDDKPIAVAAVSYEGDDEWYVVFIASEEYEKKKTNAIHTKRFLEIVADKFEIKRLITHSENDERLSVWHNFMGFKLEEENAEVIKGIKHNLWSREWVQQQQQ